MARTTRVSQQTLNDEAGFAARRCSDAMSARIADLTMLGWKVFSVSQATYRGELLAGIGLSNEIHGKLTSRWLQFDGQLYAPPAGKTRYEWNWDTMAARKTQWKQAQKEAA